MQAQRMKNQRKKFIFTFIFLLFFLVTGVVLSCDAYYIKHCEPVDLTDLSKREIEEIVNERYGLFFAPVYHLKSREYHLIDNFHEVKHKTIRHDIWYAYYTISFQDKYGEEVVMAAKVDRHYVDLEEEKTDLYGRLARMDNDNFKRLRQNTGDEESGNMILKDLTHRQADKARVLYACMMIVSGACLILLIVRWIQQH